jgi:hypothetical protein
VILILDSGVHRTGELHTGFLEEAFVGEDTYTPKRGPVES